MDVPVNRALPAHMIDLIRDGVPADALTRSADRAVYNALFRTAASAVQRSQDYWEWAALVQDPASHLGRQLGRNSRGKARTRQAIDKTMFSAWDKATVWVSEQERPWTKQTARDEACLRAEALLLVCADMALPLLDSDRAVLSFAAREVMRRGVTRVALPRRAVMQGAAVGERAARSALDRLNGTALLTLEDAGRAAGPSAKRPPRAALYEAAPVSVTLLYLYRETRSVGPLRQICGTPLRIGAGTPLQFCGTPDLLVREARGAVSLAS